MLVKLHLGSFLRAYVLGILLSLFFSSLEQAHWYYEDHIADTHEDSLKHLRLGQFARQVWLGCLWVCVGVLGSCVYLFAPIQKYVFTEMLPKHQLGVIQCFELTYCEIFTRLFYLWWISSNNITITVTYHAPSQLFEFSELLAPELPNFGALYTKFKDYRNKIPTYGCILLNEELTKMVLICGFKVSLLRAYISHTQDNRAYLLVFEYLNMCNACSEHTPPSIHHFCFCFTL